MLTMEESCARLGTNSCTSAIAQSGVLASWRRGVVVDDPGMGCELMVGSGLGHDLTRDDCLWHKWGSTDCLGRDTGGLLRGSVCPVR